MTPTELKWKDEKGVSVAFVSGQIAIEWSVSDSGDYWNVWHNEHEITVAATREEGKEICARLQAVLTEEGRTLASAVSSPNDPRGRLGAVLACGCWTWDVRPGSRQGKDFAYCSNCHYDSLITQTNVDEFSL